jgi:hypothetical protein
MKKSILVSTIILLLTSCSGYDFSDKNPSQEEKGTPGLFSKDSKKGISISDILSRKDNLSGNMNVNGYLWRASINILSIAPLVSTDAFGGTIITDWYMSKDIINQRVKITAYVLGSELRSDAIKVTAHIQNLKNKVWSDIYEDNDLANNIEENILNEARELRINSKSK